MHNSLFPSFLLGGFECSSHRNPARQRLDMIAATRHDEFAVQDYARLREFGILAARDGIRWHLIEKSPGHYDWSSAVGMVRAARAAGVKVVWDACHYGWPDDLDPMGPEFAPRFAALCRAFVELLREEGEDAPFVCPVNETSFLAWAGGTVGWLSPFLQGCGGEFKRQLARATVVGCEAMLEAAPGTRLFHIDPMCNVVARADASLQERADAEIHRLSQYEAWDMIAGRRDADLGGREGLLDVLGVNYYADNQWLSPGSKNANSTLGPGHPSYRPVWEMLREVHERYGRPLLIAETGIEGARRSLWLRHIAREARRARQMGVQVEGLCFYPITDYPGWDDERHCETGLWGYADDTGHRPVFEPLARAMRGQMKLRIENKE